MLPRVRIKDDQRGTALIEFALILPFLLVIAFTVVDLSRAFWYRSVLTSAAREGARAAILLGTPGDTTGADYGHVVDRVNDVLSDYGLTSSRVQVEGPDGSQQVAITVQSNFTWLYLGALNSFSPGMFTNPQPLTASAVMQMIGSS